MATLRETCPKQIDEILHRFPQKRSASIPLLYLAWETYGYVTPESMIEVAEIVGASPAYIQGIASFYTLFPLQPRGTYHIELCSNLSCRLRGAREVLQEIEKKLGIRCGERTEDGRFSLESVECLAGCSWAPCLHINGKEYTGLTPESVNEILDSLSN